MKISKPHFQCVRWYLKNKPPSFFAGIFHLRDQVEGFLFRVAPEKWNHSRVLKYKKGFISSGTEELEKWLGIMHGWIFLIYKRKKLISKYWIYFFFFIFE